MNVTEKQERKLLDATRRQKLVAMLQSMSRNYPNTRLRTTWDGFGALLDDGRTLHISYSGNWTKEDMRSFAVLFAMWLDVDYDVLTATMRDGPHGLFMKAVADLLYSNGQEGSHGNP